MRRLSRFALVVLALGFSTRSTAAQTVGTGFTLGWASSGQEKSQHVGSVAAAAFLDIHLNRNFSFQPEVAFVRKGASTSAILYEETPPQPPTVTVYRWDLRYAYVEAPLLFRLDMPIQPGLRPFVAAGPYLGLNLGSWCNYTGPSYGATTCDTLLAAEPPLRRLDTGVVLAGGVQLRITQRYWLVTDARYELGERSVYDPTPSAPSPLRNRSIILSVGVMRQRP